MKTSSICRYWPNAVALAGAVIVGTQKSPAGTAIGIAWVHEAIDRRRSAGELEITTTSLGPIGHPSDFIGAVLREIDEVVVVSKRPAGVAVQSED